MVNLDLAEEDQVSVVIKTPTAAETASIARNPGSGVDTNEIMLGVSRFVKSIKNLKVSGKAIINGKELAAATGMYVLCLNIGSHILGMLTEVDKDPNLIPFRLWLRGVHNEIKEYEDKLSAFEGIVDPVILRNLGYSVPNKKYYAGSPNNADSDYFVNKSEIEGYFSNYNYITAFNVWYKFHLNMGFPFTGGWAEQPWWIVEFISLLEILIMRSKKLNIRNQINQIKL